ncbi:MAG: sigma 54-interacting transcriptional regulator [Bacillota bacterium]
MQAHFFTKHLSLLESMINVINYCPVPMALYDENKKKIFFNQAALTLQENLGTGRGKIKKRGSLRSLFTDKPNYLSGPEQKNFFVIYLPFKDEKETFTLAVVLPEKEPSFSSPNLQAIIESSYDGIIVTDRGGKILIANQAYERLTGNKVKNVLGRNIYELGQEGVHADPLVDLVVKRKKPATNTQYSPQQRTCLMITGSPVFDQNGEVQWVVLNFRDITELNQLQYELNHVRELTRRYSGELAELRKQVVKETNIIANSPAMKKAIELALHVAKVDSTVLIQGESGVGKELIAKIIHHNSSRSLGPFIKINCAAIPETLIESELFGHEPGAFTGANKQGKAGLFELAHNGTLLLDEIGDLPLSIQGKLLRSLQEQEITRVGGTKIRKVNVRVIAATNQDLKIMAREKRFREDLYFRLNVVPIFVPPLRERQEDIIPLLFFYQDFFNKKYNLKKEFTPDAISVLAQYHWPGNVRELVNVVERLLVTSVSPVISSANLPEEIYSSTMGSHEVVSIKGIIPLKQAVEELERQLLEKALVSYGSTYKAAEALKIDQSTIVKKLKKLRSKGC